MQPFGNDIENGHRGVSLWSFTVFDNASFVPVVACGVLMNDCAWFSTAALRMMYLFSFSRKAGVLAILNSGPLGTQRDAAVRPSWEKDRVLRSRTERCVCGCSSRCGSYANVIRLLSCNSLIIRSNTDESLFPKGVEGLSTSALRFEGDSSLFEKVHLG